MKLFKEALGMVLPGRAKQPKRAIPQPAAFSEADRAWAEALRAMSTDTREMTEQIDPVLLASYLQQLGIDPSILTAAGFQAGGEYADLAQTMGERAGLEFGRADDIYNLARDPNNVLHDRMLQQVIEGSRVADSARGIAMGGESVGHENQARSNFNMDWQDRLLGRTRTGLEAAGTAGTRGAGYAERMPGYTMASAQVPIQAQTTAAQMPANAAMTYAGNVQQGQISPWDQMMNQIMPYLGVGVGAGTNLYNAQMQKSKYDSDQNAAFMKMIYQGMSQIGGGGGGAGSGAPGGGTGMTTATGTGGLPW